MFKNHIVSLEECLAYTFLLLSYAFLEYYGTKALNHYEHKKASKALHAFHLQDFHLFN